MARQFRDAAGVEWTVYVTQPSTTRERRVQVLAEEYRSGWLVFESEIEKRRLAPVPAGWSELSDEGLAALCAGASPQAPRRRAASQRTRDIPAQSAAEHADRPSAATQPLRTELDEVTTRLDSTLDQVCDERSHDPGARRIDTGELIRVEETLAMAAEMAKEVVTLRRKLRAPAPERNDREEDRPR